MEIISPSWSLYFKLPWDRLWNIIQHSMYLENESEKVYNSIVQNQQNLISTQTITKNCLTIKPFGLLMIQMLIE